MPDSQSLKSSFLYVFNKKRKFSTVEENKASQKRELLKYYESFPILVS